MKQATFGIACLSIGFAAVAVAQNAQNPATNPGSQKIAPPMQFKSLDSNKDGRVSKEEVKAHNELNSSFTTLDINSDSYLSESEFDKWDGKAPSSPGGNMATPERSPGGAQSPGASQTPGASQSPGATQPGGAQSPGASQSPGGASQTPPTNR